MHSDSMKIGYARGSTDEQHLNLQQDILRNAGCEKAISDKGISEKIFRQEGLGRAIKQLKNGDVLVMWKLDRLGRSLKGLIERIEALREKEAGFQRLSDGINTTTAGGKLVFHIMGALSEFERSLIFERT